MRFPDEPCSCELLAERDAGAKMLARQCDLARDAERDRDASRALLREVAESGYMDIDARLDYVEVQVGRDTWQAVRKAAGMEVGHV